MRIDLYQGKVYTDRFTDETCEQIEMLTIEQAIEKGVIDQIEIDEMQDAMHREALRWGDWCNCECCQREADR